MGYFSDLDIRLTESGIVTPARRRRPVTATQRREAVECRDCRVLCSADSRCPCCVRIATNREG